MLNVILLATLMGETANSLIFVQSAAGWGAAMPSALVVGSVVSIFADRCFCIWARIRPELVATEPKRPVQVL